MVLLKKWLFVPLSNTFGFRINYSCMTVSKTNALVKVTFIKKEKENNLLDLKIQMYIIIGPKKKKKMDEGWEDGDCNY